MDGLYTLAMAKDDNLRCLQSYKDRKNQQTDRDFNEICKQQMPISLLATMASTALLAHSVFV